MVRLDVAQLIIGLPARTLLILKQMAIILKKKDLGLNKNAGPADFYTCAQIV